MPCSPPGSRSPERSKTANMSPCFRTRTCSSARDELASTGNGAFSFGVASMSRGCDSGRMTAAVLRAALVDPHIIGSHAAGGEAPLEGPPALDPAQIPGARDGLHGLVDALAGEAVHAV